MKGSEKFKTKIAYGYTYCPAVLRINGRYIIGLYRQVWLQNITKPIIEFYSQEFGFSFHKPEKFYRNSLVKRYDRWIRYLLIKNDVMCEYIDRSFFFDKAVNGFMKLSREDFSQISLLRNQLGITV